MTTDLLVLLAVAALLGLAVVLPRRSRKSAAEGKAAGPTLAEAARAAAGVEGGTSEATPETDGTPESAATGGGVRVELRDVAFHEAELAELEATQASPGKQAAAAFRLGMVVARAGDMARARTLLERAVTTPADDASGEQDRLEYEVHLCELLVAAGEVAAAEERLRKALPAREAAYGRLNAGYAFGLAPLARLLVAKGEATAAVTLVDEMMAVLAATRHEQAPAALALSTLVRLAAGTETPSLAKMEEAEVQPYLAGLVEACNGAPPAVHRAALESGIALLTGRGKLDSPAGAQLLGMHGQVCQQTGALNEAMQSWDQASRLYAGAADWRQALAALLSMAALASQVGDNNTARRVFDVAAERLGAAPYPWQTRLQRERGLFLTRAAPDEAAAALEKAVEMSRDLADAPVVVGETVGALGAFLLRTGRPTDALPLLTEALSLLPEGHPERVAISRHADMAARGEVPPPSRAQQLEQRVNMALAGALPGVQVRARVTETPQGVNCGFEFLSGEPSQEQVESARRVLESILRAPIAAGA